MHTDQTFIHSYIPSTVLCSVHWSCNLPFLYVGIDVYTYIQYHLLYATRRDKKKPYVPRATAASSASESETQVHSIMVTLKENSQQDPW